MDIGEVDADVLNLLKKFFDNFKVYDPSATNKIPLDQIPGVTILLNSWLIRCNYLE